MLAMRRPSIGTFSKPSSSRMPGIRAVAAALVALSIAGAGVPAARVVRGGVEASAQQPAAPPPAAPPPATPSAATPSAATSAPAHVVSRSTPHLKFTATISPAVIVPGARMSIAFDVVPKKGMHVYAPGTKYRPVSIRLQPGSLLRIHGSIYPKPTLYTFKPLKEDVLVYDAPFRLVVDVVAADFDALRAELRGRSQITIKGTLDYQACDDGVCYLPASVLFQWTLKVAGR
jgi:cytochrome c biogenesis DsbD-like protein